MGIDYKQEPDILRQLKKSLADLKVDQAKLPKPLRVGKRYSLRRGKIVRN